MDVFLARQVADDAVRAGMRTRDGFDAPGCPRDERHSGATALELADEREPQTRRAAGNGGPDAVEVLRRIDVSVTCHGISPCVLRTSSQEPLKTVNRRDRRDRGEGKR